METSLLYETFTLGPLNNNSYLIIDPETKETAIIDPPMDSSDILEYIKEKAYNLAQVWLTHAHFDHIGGIPQITSALQKKPVIGLHPLDSELYQMQGGAALFGYHLPVLSIPTMQFFHNQKIKLGQGYVEVRHTPGHTSGHVIFVIHEAGLAFCGDLIFYHSVGRTDLPGGNHANLIRSIETQILSLPSETRLLSGHGPATTIAEEIKENPYIF
jgi:hydroxyacylglutathione hydrolase